MQPYRNVATTQFLPIYWNYEQCLCENCLKSPHQESSSCVVSDNTQKTSFSIESLLSRKDGPKTDQCMVSPSLKMSGVPSSTTRQLPNDATELLHGYLAHFRHPPSFAQVPLFGRGNFHANGELTNWREILKIHLVSLLGLILSWYTSFYYHAKTGDREQLQVARRERCERNPRLYLKPRKFTFRVFFEIDPCQIYLSLLLGVKIQRRYFVIILLY